MLPNPHDQARARAIRTRAQEALTEAPPLQLTAPAYLHVLLSACARIVADLERNRAKNPRVREIESYKRVERKAQARRNGRRKAKKIAKERERMEQEAYRKLFP